MKESWKKIEEFPNYSISSFGRVRNDKMYGKIVNGRSRPEKGGRTVILKNSDGQREMSVDKLTKTYFSNYNKCNNDVVAVVRCRNCVHYSYCDSSSGPDGYCDSGLKVDQKRKN